ncbi:hypothetical protein DM01DRAFT_1377357 [Hesseltinella vesiculosa]|uniref:Uncharacterized protein n=1 Tax=Hesseltinella vesiculosa TaxID=101127 RepID=A0A1X2G7W3_9FUNG|nr:hypothetical protein DM01DRAFT_1377357 [Hesseltinella vesiculosa]
MAPPQSWNSYLHEHGIIATPPTIDYWKLCIAGGDGCNDAFVSPTLPTGRERHMMPNANDMHLSLLEGSA